MVRAWHPHQSLSSILTYHCYCWLAELALYSLCKHYFEYLIYSIVITYWLALWINAEHAAKQLWSQQGPLFIVSLGYPGLFLNPRPKILDMYTIVFHLSGISVIQPSHRSWVPDQSSPLHAHKNIFWYLYISFTVRWRQATCISLACPLLWICSACITSPSSKAETIQMGCGPGFGTATCSTQLNCHDLCN